MKRLFESLFFGPDSDVTQISLYNSPASLTFSPSDFDYLNTPAHSYSVPNIKTVFNTGDDYAGDASTTGEAIPGSFSSGEFHDATDVDWFALDVIAGETYQIRYAMEFPGQISYVDENGNNLSGQFTEVDEETLENIHYYTAETTGTIYVAAYASEFDLGGLEISFPAGYSFGVVQGGPQVDVIPGDSSTQEVITIGEEVVGRIDETQDSDWFGLSLDAGQTVIVWGLFNNANRVGLYGSDESLLQESNVNSNGFVSFTASSAGQYYLGLSSDFGSSDYNFTVYDLPDDPGESAASSAALGAGQTIAGINETETDEDWYTITPDETGRIIITLSSDRSNGFSLSIVDADGNRQDNVNADSRDTIDGFYISYFSLDVIQGESFNLIVNSETLNDSAYLLNHGGTAADDYLASSDTQGFISVGQTINGAFETAGDQDWIAFDAVAGDQFMFTYSHGVQANMFVGTVDSEGVSFGEFSEGFTGTDYTYFFTATETGRYYISLSGDVPIGTAYTLAMQDSPDAHGQDTTITDSLGVGQSATATINYASDQDWWAIDVTAGELWRFNLDFPSNADWQLNLYDADGNFVSQQNYNAFENPNDTSIFLTLEAAYTGQYFIGVSASSGLQSQTEFTIDARRFNDDYAGNATTSAIINDGDLYSGKLEIWQDKDWFAFNGTAGDVVSFALWDPDNAVQIRILDANGTQLNDPFNAYATLAFTGTFYVEVSVDFSQNLSDDGNYEYQLLRRDFVDEAGQTNATALDIEGGEIYGGRISNVFDQDWYRMELNQGDTLTFNLYQPNGLEYLIIDSDGNVQDPAVNQALEVSVSGTYFLVVRDVSYNAPGINPNQFPALDYTFGFTLNGQAPSWLTESDDSFTASSTGQSIYGSGGNDALTGRSGADTLFGGFDNDTLFGAGGNDRLDGGEGEDWLSGGDGADKLTGGAGRDIFAFDLSDGQDVITDFELFQDRIELGLSPFTSWSELVSMADQIGNDTVFDFGNGHSITLLNVSLSDLTLDHFIFNDGSDNGIGPFRDPGLTYDEIKRAGFDTEPEVTFQSEKDETPLVAEVLETDFENSQEESLISAIKSSTWSLEDFELRFDRILNMPKEDLPEWGEWL